MSDEAHPASIGLHEAFDRHHDGMQFIDPAKTALALFVGLDGVAHVRCPGGDRMALEILRSLVAATEARVAGQ